MVAVGQELRVKGNFTTLGFLEGLSRAALERTVGFHTGRLSKGFVIIALAEGEAIYPRDFELKASTRWSGGHIPASGAASKVEIETLLAARGQSVDSLKAKVSAFFARRGKNTPAKVLPALEHKDGMMYPNAEALAPGTPSGVPQFNLLVPKQFVAVRVENAQ